MFTLTVVFTNTHNPRGEDSDRTCVAAESYTDADLCRILKGATSLTRLDLHANLNQSLATSRKWVECCPNLTFLRIDDTYAAGSVKSLEVILRAFPRLTFLAFGCEYFDVPENALLQAVARYGRKLRALVVAVGDDAGLFSWSEGVLPVLEQCRSLCVLNFCRAEIISRSVRDLNHALVPRRGRTTDGAAVGGSLCLEELRGAHTSDGGVPLDLVFLGANCPQLRVVHASWHSDVGVPPKVDVNTALSALAAGCPQLDTLHVSAPGADGTFTDSGVMKLARGCPKLRTLFLKFGDPWHPEEMNARYSPTAPTDAALEALIRGCPQLKNVYISNKWRCTDAGLFRVSRLPEFSNVALFCIFDKLPDVTITGVVALVTSEAKSLRVVDARLGEKSYSHELPKAQKDLLDALRQHYPDMEICGWYDGPEA